MIPRFVIPHGLVAPPREVRARALVRPFAAVLGASVLVQSSSQSEGTAFTRAQPRSTRSTKPDASRNTSSSGTARAQSE